MEAALPSMKSVTERGPGDNEPGLRPPIDETGGDADASFWARPVDQLRGQKNALLHILVNNTGQPLTRVDFEYNDSGKWYEEPPAGIGAVSTAVWASCGAAGPLGISTGTCGAVVFRAPGEFDVVLAYSRPVLGDDKVGGGVFAGGFVTAQKLSRKATPGHNSSRCSYDRLVDTMQMASPQVRAHKGVHIAWHGAAELPGSFPQHRKWGVRCAVFVLSDEPPQIEKLLRPLIQKAKRSMLVRVENHTLLPLRKRGEKSPSGQWRTEAPDVIPGETSTIFATESTGGGTDACVTYAVSIATGAVTAEALVMLRWVSPLVATKGVYVEVSTEFSCSPGLVVEWEGPQQQDNSEVCFKVRTEAGAQPGRFHPEKGSTRTGRILGRAAAAGAKVPARIEVPSQLLALPAARRMPQSGVEKQLRERAAKASRSMVAKIDNQTPFSLVLMTSTTNSGIWSPGGEPPQRIEPNEAVFVASESRGAGTEAEVLYTGQLDVGSGRKAQVMLMLQWFNPKIADKLGKWVETETKFNCNPGLVVHRNGPEQRDNSSVVFTLMLKDGAEPMHYNPATQRSVHTQGQKKSSGAEPAGIAQAQVALDPNDVVWRRQFQLVDIWEITADTEVRSGPHLESQLLGTLLKGQKVRLTEECWVRAAGDWAPSLRYRLAGAGCVTQSKEGAVTRQDGGGAPSFKVHKPLAVRDAGSGYKIGSLKKGQTFFGLRQRTEDHGVEVASECWIGRWDKDTLAPVCARRRSQHPPLDGPAVNAYHKREIELPAGESTKQAFRVKKGSVLHWQIWHDGQRNPIRTQTLCPPGLAVAPVTFRRSQTLVQCFPIKTFEADDFPVATIDKGDVVRELNLWRDTDRRMKIQHTSRRGGERPYWSLQPPLQEDDDKYLRKIPDMLGLNRSEQVAMGEFTGAEDGRVTIHLDNTDHKMSETLTTKTVTVEVVSYGSLDADAGAEPEPEPELEPARESTARLSRRSVSRRSTAFGRGGFGEPHEELMALLRERVSTGYDPELLVEQYCNEQGLLSKDGLRSLMCALGVEPTEAQLSAAGAFFGFPSGEAEAAIDRAAFIQRVLPPRPSAPVEGVPPTGAAAGADPSRPTADTERLLRSSRSSAWEEADDASAALKSGRYDWLVDRCPFRVTPTMARWSIGVTNLVSPGTSGAAWGAATGAAVFSVVPVLGTATGAVLGGVVGGIYGARTRTNDLDGVYYEIHFRQRVIYRSFGDFNRLALLLCVLGTLCASLTRLLTRPFRTLSLVPFRNGLSRGYPRR